ncbi:TPA: hypothetical protein U1C94_000077 [Streptococcus suis]|nr:hypothetical protein [Streptococcus suis]
MNKYEHIPPVVENLKNPQIIEYIEDLNKVSKTEFSGMETELTKVFAENKKVSTARTDCE